jgi:hypothetical protein
MLEVVGDILDDSILFMRSNQRSATRFKPGLKGIILELSRISTFYSRYKDDSSEEQAAV